MNKPFSLIESETTYRGRVFDVRRDHVRLPDGGDIHLDVVAHSGAVTVVPIDESGRVYLVRQYRHAVGEDLLEFPAGTLEEGEDPESCAARELREEVGMAGADFRLIGTFYLAPGYSTEFMFVYLARNLSPSPLPGDEDEFLSVETMGIQDLYAMADRGDLKDAKSLAALHLARRYVLG